jgi:hypothetical protein
MATTAAVEMGHSAAAAVGMGQGAAAAIGMGNGISTPPRRATAPRPRLRAMERTLSFRLNNGGSRIRLETLLGRWPGAAATNTTVRTIGRPDQRISEFQKLDCT